MESRQPVHRRFAQESLCLRWPGQMAHTAEGGRGCGVLALPRRLWARSGDGLNCSRLQAGVLRRAAGL